VPVSARPSSSDVPWHRGDSERSALFGCAPALSRESPLGRSLNPRGRYQRPWGLSFAHLSFACRSSWCGRGSVHGGVGSAIAGGASLAVNVSASLMARGARWCLETWPCRPEPRWRDRKRRRRGTTERHVLRAPAPTWAHEARPSAGVARRARRIFMLLSAACRFLLTGLGERFETRARRAVAWRSAREYGAAIHARGARAFQRSARPGDRSERRTGARKIACYKPGP